MDAPSILAGHLEALPRNVRERRRVPLGSYGGLRFGIVLHPHFGPDVYLEGALTRQAGFLSDHQGPRAVLNAVERLARSYGSECDRVKQDLAIAEAQLRDYQACLGRPFQHESYLAELTALRDRLKTGLAGMTAEPGEIQMGVAELAKRIKELKAAHTVDATSERSGTRTQSAEMPVTARIRRRLQAILAADRSIGPEADQGQRSIEPG